MRNITVFSNRLDESNGTVENVLEMKTTTKKTPWHLRFAPKVKGIVSFVQNLLTRKEGVRGGPVSAFFQLAAAVAVGIGLLAGSTAAIQAACHPPIYDPCFHKSNWTSAGYATLYVEFDLPSGKVGAGQLYEVQWNGLKKLFDSSVGDFVLTDKSDSDEGLSGYDKISFSYGNFWWVPLSMWNNYGCTIYEGHWDYNNQDENGRPTWVRGTQVASLDFYHYQDAALVYLDTSVAPFEFSQYYHTIDYDTDLPPGYLRHGYSEGYWVYAPWQWNPNYPHHRPWFYMGDPGSPRFHYRQLCSVTIGPPPRTPSNTRPR